MRGMRHSESRCGGHHEDYYGAGRHGHYGRHRHGRHGGRGDMGSAATMRAGRMLAQGDLRLLALALIAEQPRHGYEIIKVLEDKTGGWYAPSPGVVYPTLTYLEEAGYVTVQADGAKRLYTITTEGRAYLEENRDFVDALLERLEAVGEQAREASQPGRRQAGDAAPGALGLGESCATSPRSRLKGDPDAEAKVVEILARAAGEVKKS